LRTLFCFILVSIVVAFFAPMLIEMKVAAAPWWNFVGTFIVVLFLVPVTAIPIYKIITSKHGYSLKTVLKSSVISVCFVSSFFVFPNNLESSFVNGQVIVESGSITLIEYFYAFIQLSLFAIVGLLAGLLFFYSKKGASNEIN